MGEINPKEMMNYEVIRIALVLLIFNTHVTAQASFDAAGNTEGRIVFIVASFVLIFMLMLIMDR